MLIAPRLYPDELLGPALIRCCRWYNLPFKVFAREVLGLPQLRANFLGVWPLCAIAPQYRVSPEHLLWNHTPFPYASGFLHGESFAMAAKAALHGGGGMSHLSAVMQNACMGLSYRKVCSQCVQEDLDVFGETYWHRSHNLPGVLMCAKHRCALSATRLAVSGELKTVYDLPIECDTVALPSVRRSLGILDLALRSVRLLNRKENPGEARNSDTYRALAFENGWLSKTRPVNEAALAQAVESRFSQDYLAAAGLPISGRLQWPALGLRASTFNFTPVKHLILETALSTKPEQQNVLDHVSTGPSGTEDSAVDRFYAPRARHELIEALKAGESMTTEQFLRRCGALGPYRHRGAALPKLRRVVLEFRASPASVKQLRPGRTLFRNSPDIRVPKRPTA
jgi:hypothetical protein